MLRLAGWWWIAVSAIHGLGGIILYFEQWQAIAQAGWFNVIAPDPFAPIDEHFAMWWVQAGHLPTVEEGKAKLEYLELHGDTPECFTFAEPYALSELGKYLIE
jgi:hypothetical protein